MIMRRPTKRRKTKERLTDSIPTIPTFDAATEYSQALLAYQHCHVVLLKNAWRGVGLDVAATTESTAATTTTPEAYQKSVYTTLHEIALQSPSDLQETWNLELALKHSLSPLDILCAYPRNAVPRVPAKTSKKVTGLPRKWYASFILKAKDSVATLLPSLPVPTLPNDTTTETTLRHGKAVWCFVGRNKTRTGLMGRPEHTDSVRHDGTWHFQVSGTKTWHLRPTQQLCAAFVSSTASTASTASSTSTISAAAAALMNRSWSAHERVHVDVEAGDVLLVDTKSWWHQTEIPCTLSACEEISMSVARDIYVQHDAKEMEEKEEKEEEEEEEDDMTNVDWLYAPHDIPKGEIVLTEDDVPDAAFPESHSPNCDVLEDEDSGKMVVVASRDITSGEFFSVAFDDDGSGDEE